MGSCVWTVGQGGEVVSVTPDLTRPGEDHEERVFLVRIVKL